jgi:hypothetical protein
MALRGHFCFLFRPIYDLRETAITFLTVLPPSVAARTVRGATGRGRTLDRLTAAQRRIDRRPESDDLIVLTESTAPWRDRPRISMEQLSCTHIKSASNRTLRRSAWVARLHDGAGVETATNAAKPVFTYRIDAS